MDVKVASKILNCPPPYTLQGVQKAYQIAVARINAGGMRGEKQRDSRAKLLKDAAEAKITLIAAVQQ